MAADQAPRSSANIAPASATSPAITLIRRVRTASRAARSCRAPDVGPAGSHGGPRPGELGQRRRPHRAELAAERHRVADELLHRGRRVDVHPGERADHERVGLGVAVAGVDGERPAAPHHLGGLAEPTRRVREPAPGPQQQRLRAQVPLVLGQPFGLPVPPAELGAALDREDVREVVRHHLAAEPIARRREQPVGLAEIAELALEVRPPPRLGQSVQRPPLPAEVAFGLEPRARLLEDGAGPPHPAGVALGTSEREHRERGEVAVARPLREPLRPSRLLDRLGVLAHLDQDLRESDRGARPRRDRPPPSSAARSARRNRRLRRARLPAEHLLGAAGQVLAATSAAAARRVRIGTATGELPRALVVDRDRRHRLAAPRAPRRGATRRSRRAARRGPPSASRRTPRRGSARASTRTRWRRAPCCVGGRVQQVAGEQPVDARAHVRARGRAPRAPRPTRRRRRRRRRAGPASRRAAARPAARRSAAGSTSGPRAGAPGRPRATRRRRGGPRRSRRACRPSPRGTARCRSPARRGRRPPRPTRRRRASPRRA